MSVDGAAKPNVDCKKESINKVIFVAHLFRNGSSTLRDINLIPVVVDVVLAASWAGVDDVSTTVVLRR